jgi:hypothetical protein
MDTLGVENADTPLTLFRNSKEILKPFHITRFIIISGLFDGSEILVTRERGDILEYVFQGALYGIGD